MLIRHLIMEEFVVSSYEEAIEILSASNDEGYKSSFTYEGMVWKVTRQKDNKFINRGSDNEDIKADQ